MIFLVHSNSVVADPEQKNSNSASVDIEVVEIVGQFDKSTWKTILRDAQKDFFSAFNEIAPYKFDIKCDYELTKTGSKIRTLICHPNFIRLNQSKASALYGTSLANTLIRQNFANSPHKKRYQNKLNKMDEIELKKMIVRHISQDKELAKKYERFQKAQVAYELAED